MQLSSELFQHLSGRALRKRPSCLAKCLLSLAALLTLVTPSMAMAAIAQPADLILTAGSGEYVLGGRADILEDPDGSVTLEDILSTEIGSRFMPSTQETPGFGFTESVYWLRIQIRNESGRGGNWLLELDYSPMERIDLYIVRSGQTVEHHQGGSRQPFNERDLQYRAPIFELNIDDGEQVTLLLRASTESSMILPLTLWQPETFAEQTSQELYVRGIYYGLIGAMIFYNLFIWVTIREKSYLFYILFLSFFALYQMALQGLWQQYLWPHDMPWSNRYLAMAGSTAVLFGLLFAHSFLGIRQNHPNFYRAGMVLLAISATALVLSVVGTYRQATMTMSLSGGLVVLYALTVGVVATLKGYKPARYFMVAWLVLVVGTVLQMLRAYGVLPSNFVTVHSMQIGSALEAILLALALAARIRTMKEEKEAAQQGIVENMRRMDELKDEFLANTSHELRTPINGMTGLAEAIIQNRGDSLSADERSNLELIVTSGRRLNNLVNDILDFSKLQHHDLVLATRPVDVKAVADVAMELLKPLAASKGLEVRSTMPVELPFAYADENRLQQILQNLIGNAIKFTAKGFVEISAEQRGNELCVHVQDTGIGIAQNQSEEIFESFRQADGSIARQYGGTGLGLSITRQLVELHGGQISVYSRPGEGSVFTFTLPVSESTVNGARPAINSQANTGGPLPDSTRSEITEPAVLSPALVAMANSGADRKGSILVVDDESINRQVLRSQLTGVGYHVIEAEDGETALNCLDQQAGIDLVLLDVMMPKLSGYDVCRKLRARWNSEQLPIIFLTARTRDEDVIAAFHSGANDYLSKPFSRDELQARVALHLDLCRKYQDLAARNRELSELTQANRSLEKISLTDHLTGLKNRRYFEVRYHEEREQAQRLSQPLSIVILDIDHFKRFNDTYGHVAGDECLRQVAATLQKAVCRPYDTLCRYGGEEFIVVLPSTNLENAAIVAERIRQSVETTSIDVEGNTLSVTVSVGVATGTPLKQDPEDLLVLEADKALYEAKETGRNRIEVRAIRSDSSGSSPAGQG